MSNSAAAKSVSVKSAAVKVAPGSYVKVARDANGKAIRTGTAFVTYAIESDNKVFTYTNRRNETVTISAADFAKKWAEGYNNPKSDTKANTVELSFEV